MNDIIQSRMIMRYFLIKLIF